MTRRRSRFDELVAEALDLIPPAFTRYLDNVSIEIHDQPAAATLAELEVPPGESLFGLYEGVPQTERGESDPLFPDRILIYRQPLEAAFPDPDELRREVARTVIHEIAHHFGIDEERLAELGWD